MRKAIKQYAADNGRSWKSKLAAEWSSNSGLSQELQAARNIIGPRQLAKITAATLRRL